METIFDVIRHLTTLLGNGELRERANEIIDAAEGKDASAAPPAPADPEGTSK